MYANWVKRVVDLILSLIAIAMLSPPFLILLIAGAIEMGGNPFFVQNRPGKDEKIIKLLKFRTMTNERDKRGNLFPDEKRLVPYGKFLRSTSLDELPSLINIIKGDLAIIGPRPLLIEYLPWYTDEERHRHDVRPGLTGWAQVNGRNSIDWETRFQLDLEYIGNITFKMDLKIFLLTIKKVISRSDIADNTRDAEGNCAEIRQMQIRNKR